MKTTVTTMLCLCLSFFGNCQLTTLNTTSKTVTSIETPDPVSRYGKDYILKDYTFDNGDSTILYKLNLDHLEQFRKPTESIDVVDPYTQLVVTLFGRKLVAAPDNHLLNEE